jgi:DNA-binding transcriptional LysR family regulator
MTPEQGLELTHSFLVVAQELNFKRAGERLNIDQSALTRRIQKLEQGLGFALFERTTRQVFLTPAGQSFLKTSAAMLQGYSHAVSEARRIAEGKSGVLRIAYMEFAAIELMPLAVARYRERHPEIELSLRYIRTQGQKLALSRHEIDVGYMVGPFEHTDFHARTLVRDPLCVVMPRHHRLTRQASIRPADLAGESLILGDMAEWEAYRGRLSDIFAAEGMVLKVALEASNTMALLGLVSAGLGVTIYPKRLVNLLGNSIDARPIAHPAFGIETTLVWNRSSSSKFVRSFVDLARKT